MFEDPCGSHFSRMINVLRAIGIDRAVGFTVIGKAWLSVAGIISLVFVSHCLSPWQQGYYYTFASLLALQVFVELGLTNVIVQFASHERAGLELAPRGTLEGSPATKSRLGSLLRLALRWFGVAAGLFAAALIAVGFTFFNRFAGSEADVGWRIPWIGTVLATAGIMMLLPVLALLEGCGFVAEVARFRVFQSAAANVALWIALAGGAGLASAAIFATTSLLAGLVWLGISQRTLLYDLFVSVEGETIAWGSEIWPYQWRIAVSWLCGYFTFQLFTPAAFAFYGPVEAGRMGMAITLAGAVMGIGASWLTTKVPQFGALVSLRRFEEMDRIFLSAVKQAGCVSAVAGGCVLSLAGMLTMFQHPLAARLMPLGPLALLLLATFANLLVSAQAIYLRAFKREPFLMVSIVNATLVACMTCFLGKWIGLPGMMAGYLLITWIAGLGLGTWIFLHCRRAWQGEFLGGSELGGTGSSLTPLCSRQPRIASLPAYQTAPSPAFPQPSRAGGS